MGHGGVGKTSLVNRLACNEFVPNLANTKEIRITLWPVKVNRQEVQLHIWDFGGHDITYATHQFFMTARGVTCSS